MEPGWPSPELDDFTSIVVLTSCHQLPLLPVAALHLASFTLFVSCSRHKPFKVCGTGSFAFSGIAGRSNFAGLCHHQDPLVECRRGQAEVKLSTCEPCIIVRRTIQADVFTSRSSGFKHLAFIQTFASRRTHKARHDRYLNSSPVLTSHLHVGSMSRLLCCSTDAQDSHREPSLSTLLPPVQH